MADISKEDLKKKIQEILKDADLDNTSAKKVRLDLQEKLDCDLTDRKKEVDQLVMEVIDEQTQEDEEDDGQEEEEEEEDEEESNSEDESPKKKKKKPVIRKKVAKAKAVSETGSDYSPEGSDDEDEVPSDGGGSDYEPDEPIGRVGRGRGKVTKKSRRDSDDESSGEEWGGRKKASKKGRKRKGSSDDDDSDYEKPKPKPKRASTGKGNGYTAPVKLSSELAEIVGSDEMPRHEVIKQMWKYIKDNKLQDPKNKQFIKCDEKLSKVIPTKKFRGFGMAKYLKDHMNVDVE